jgi:hypothetical protein
MRLLLLGLVVGLACAAPPKNAAKNPPGKADPAPATAGVTAPPAGGRIKDSVPERSAALNAADRDLNQGATEQRFGFEEARARREAANKAKADGGADPAGEPGRPSNGSLLAPPRQ